ncbi:hypothetical protein OAG63_01035 [Methylacidiphilales bacterium]|nr:hypothetical protein [Candidatus Methylacidiphilales bacterium]
MGWLLGAALLVIGAGALEDWYGRFDYGADGIAYLDLAQAAGRGDWHLAMSPYWSVGYPTILASVRWMYPPTPLGEWSALRVVNLICFLATYLGFLAFLSASSRYAAWIGGREETERGKLFVLIIGTGFFLLLQIENACVSRVSPDLLVSGVFFLACAISLRFFLRPAMSTAFGLGLLLGFGYVLKAIFLPLSMAILSITFLHLFLRRPNDRWMAIAKFGWALPAFALLAVPCIAATSVALGRLTLGETGALNYAWTVNHLPHGTQWQGGPPPLGQPIHPTQLLLRNPPVFAFGEPFHVTYPPIFNQFYWYDGYHKFFNLRNQLEALKLNFVEILKSFTPGPHVVVKALAEIALLLFWLAFLPGRRWEWWRRFIALWPVYLPALAGLLIYMLVVIEPRYLIGFLIVLATAPFLALYIPTELPSRKLGCVIVGLVALAAVAIPACHKRDMVRHVWNNEPYTSDTQWKTGLYLIQAGLHPGDKVASVTVGNGVFCTWAHISGVHIVAQIGNDTFDPLDQVKDFLLFADHPDVQQTVFNLFKQAGAVMVILPDVKSPLQGPGWEHIPGTDAWIHHLD